MYYGVVQVIQIVWYIMVFMVCTQLADCVVYLCILACIFIHELLYSYTHGVDKFYFKKWCQSGGVVFIYRLFWFLSGEDGLILV